MILLFFMKNVLIIGASGFLGTLLSKKLASLGYVVLALVDKRFPYDSIKGIKNITVREFVLEEIDDLYDDPSFNDIDTLYHFAWAGVNASARNDSEGQVQNVMFGLRVMEFASHHHIKRIVIPGSASEVSCSGSIITGKEIPAPSDMYATTKVATRFICQTYARQHDLELIWTLITSIYGPGRKDNNLISYAIQSLLNGEKPSTTGLEQKWDYLYVDDLIRAMILLGEYGIPGKIYPIGSGEHRQIREYVEEIRNIINPELPLGIGELPYKNPDVIDNQIIDISELSKDTGFVPKYSFSRGIKETIEYFKKL